jgi:hypothetical protein
VHSLIIYGGLEHYRVKVAHVLKANNSGFNEIIMLTEFYYYYYVLIEKGRRQYMTGREGPIPFLAILSSFSPSHEITLWNSCTCFLFYPSTYHPCLLKAFEPLLNSLI